MHHFLMMIIAIIDIIIQGCIAIKVQGDFADKMDRGCSAKKMFNIGRRKKYKFLKLQSWMILSLLFKFY